MSRQAPVTATYAHLRHVGTQPDPTPRSEPATPATWANPLGVAMAGFLILAAYLAVMAH